MTTENSFSIHSIKQSEPQSQILDQPILEAFLFIQKHYLSIGQIISNCHQSNIKPFQELFEQIKTTFDLHQKPILHQLNQILKEHDEQIDNSFDDSPMNKIISSELNQQMTFMQMVNTIIEEGVDFQELFLCLDNLKIESKQHLILLNKQQFEYQNKEDYYTPQNYFQYDISQMFIEFVSDKINSNEDLTQRQKDLVYYLTQQKDYRKISSSELQKQYHYTRQKLQLEHIQLSHFIKQVKFIESKLLDALKKNNYVPSLQNQFKKFDVTKIGRINYAGFSKSLEKLRLTLSESEISTLFRYCIYSETKVYQQLINKTFLIDYKQFLNTTFNKNYNPSSIEIVTNKLPQYRYLVNNLKTQKVELTKVLTQRDTKIQSLESKLLEYQLQHCNKQNSLHQIVKNERKVLSAKYEGEIARLQKINESQKQMIDSYRVELENIMSEIHARQMVNIRR